MNDEIVTSPSSGETPRYHVGITEVIVQSRGRLLAVTTPGERTSSGIHVARNRHPHCTLLQVRKWVARACTGTGGGFAGSSGVNA